MSRSTGSAPLLVWINFPYTRVQSFLLSYVLLTAGAEKIDLLSTQMSLWNTSRAIATSMALVAIQPEDQNGN